MGKCRSAATLWTHLITATLKSLLQGKECSEGLGAVNDTRTQEMGWERYSKENCNRFEFSDANLGQFQEGNLRHTVYNQAGKKNPQSLVYIVHDLRQGTHRKRYEDEGHRALSTVLEF